MALGAWFGRGLAGGEAAFLGSFVACMHGACGLAVGKPAAGLHVRGCPPLHLLSGRAEHRLRSVGEGSE